MVAESKLQESTIYLCKPGGEIKIRPIEERRYIQFWGDRFGNPVGLTPEEAFSFGKALVEHAIECGCDPDHGEREAV